MSVCKHYWNYDHTVYSGDKILRWCGVCGLIQHATAKNWRKSDVGENKMWGEYPKSYPAKFAKKGGEE